MKNAYDGQDIVDLYINNLEGTPTIKPDELDLIRFKTSVTMAQYKESGFQFRMESQIINDWPNICQYIIITPQGKVIFRKTKAWFLPGDTLFDTFGEALNHLNRMVKG